MTNTVGSRFAYWCLVCGVALLSIGVISATTRSGIVEAWFGEQSAGRVDYRFTSSSRGKAIIKAKRVKPGQVGTARVTIRNTGRKPIRRMTITQDRVKQGGISSALQLQVYDASTRRCLYPRQFAKGACKQFKPWNGSKRLKKLPIKSKRGAGWRPLETHVIQIRWRLAKTSPNRDQRKAASFRLVWRASA
jgi:hypothetical protein